MQISIETINGKLCTVIRRPFCADKARESLAMGVPVVVEHRDFGMTLVIDIHDILSGVLVFDKNKYAMGNNYAYNKNFINTLTILPALPRKPTKDDAALLYRYMAEGLYPACVMDNGEADDSIIQGWKWENKWHCTDGVEHRKPEITHAVTADGQRVEVAIYG